MQPNSATLNRGPLAPPSPDIKTRPGVEQHCAKGQPGTVVELHLTLAQEALLAPVVRDASTLRQHVLFVATAAPEGGVWRFQTEEEAPRGEVRRSKLAKLTMRRP